MIPGTLIHREYGQPSQCHRCGWEGIATPGEDHDLCPSCYTSPQNDALWIEMVTPRRVEKTPGRNDPCSCGSGKKFKKCHGK